MEQKNWAVVRTVVGYHRYDTAAELLLLNKIWALQSLLTNYFCPQQKLISKVRDGAKVTKKYDQPTTPHRRAEPPTKSSRRGQDDPRRHLHDLNPAAVQRQIQALTERAADPHHQQGRTQPKPPHRHLFARIHR